MDVSSNLNRMARARRAGEFYTFWEAIKAAQSCAFLFEYGGGSQFEP